MVNACIQGVCETLMPQATAMSKTAIGIFKIKVMVKVTGLLTLVSSGKILSVYEVSDCHGLINGKNHMSKIRSFWF